MRLVRGTARSRSRHFGDANIEDRRKNTDKKIDHGGVIICPKGWALTPIDEEILKKLPLEP